MKRRQERVECAIKVYVLSKTEVLHFQKRAPLRQQYNGGCVDRTFDIQLQVDK